MKENGFCMTGMHAAYAFLLGHGTVNLYGHGQNIDTMSQVRLPRLLVVAPYTLICT